MLSLVVVFTLLLPAGSAADYRLDSLMTACPAARQTKPELFALEVYLVIYYRF